MAPHPRARGGWRARMLLLLATLLLAGGAGRCRVADPGGPEGALVALPVLTGGVGRIADDQGTTLQTFTNVLTVPLRLLIEVVSGDPGEAWASDSFTCDLVGGASVAFLIVPNGAGSILTGDCFDLGFFGQPDPVTVSARAANGILVAAAADPTTNLAIPQNAILADAVVVDVALGNAFTLPAVRVRAGFVNDGNQVYRFDGLEYPRLPAGIDTTVRSPAAGDYTELVLFTLDGTPGQLPPPRVATSGIGQFSQQILPFGPPEILTFDFSLAFDCFTVVDLLSLSSGFAGFPGTDGVLQLTAQAVSTAGFDAHDAAFGDGNSVRRRPVLGWAVERRGGVTSGRLLDSLPVPLMPLLADDPPVLDADIFD